MGKKRNYKQQKIKLYMQDNFTLVTKNSITYLS